MEKVKVKKEVFDALQSFEKTWGGNLKGQLGYRVFKGDLNKKQEPLQMLSGSMLVDIAYCGYELEETTHEKMIRFYSSESSDHSYKKGMKDALDILGEKVVGINE